MAEIPRRGWQCSTCHLLIDVNLLVCPKCQTKRPNYPPEPRQPLDQIPSSMSQTEHRAEIQQRSEQQIEAQLPVQCHECGTVLKSSAKFCSECGTQLSVHSTTQNAPTNTAQISTQKEQLSECHFCMYPLQLSDSGEKQCLHCRRPQPNPQGPLCIHGCGARLIIPGAKVCARCSKPQLVRTTVRPADSVSSSGSPSEHGTRHSRECGYGYGYPNNPTQSVMFGFLNVQPFGPQQFGQQATVPIRYPPPPPGIPHPHSGHAQSGGDVTVMLGPSLTDTSSSTAGTGGNSPSNLQESPASGRSGHPHGAWSIREGRSSQESKSSGGENELKTPIQETVQDSHPQETESHPLQPDASKNSRKRKKRSESDDAGKSKLQKRNADSAEPQSDNDNSPKASSTNPAANSSSATTSDPSTTATSSDPSVISTTSTTTSGTTSATSTTTSVADASFGATRAANQDQQVASEK